MSSMQKIKQSEAADNILLDDNDRKIIQATQAGLPLVSRPYDAIAQQTGMSAEEVIRRMRNMQSLGIIRRIAAVPNHYSLGFKANGMTVWDVRDDVIDELGPVVGGLEFVSHCYQRPRSLPDWPYNLFAMVHAHTREEARSLVAIIEDLLGDANRACDVLYSTRILKKTGMRLL